MADRPIIFSAPMVKALLAGRKVQTRRITRDQPKTLKNGVWYRPLPGLPAHYQYALGGRIYGYLNIEWAPGDRLWVRENWQTLQKWDSLKPKHLANDVDKIRYSADEFERNPLWAWGKTRPSIFLPRWASRLTLSVTQVRVERLNDISEEDAAAEGIAEPYLGDGDTPFEEQAVLVSRRMQFRNLWNQIHEPGSWEANPWVAAISFSVEKRNIDV